MRFLPSLFSQLFLHLVSFSLQCLVCALLYCVLTVLCQVALTEVRVLAVRNKVEDMKVVPIYLETKNMLADIGTKSLEPKPFISLRDQAFGFLKSFLY
jgi:hypothetical protein